MYNIGYVLTRKNLNTGTGSYRRELYKKMELYSEDYSIKLSKLEYKNKIDKTLKSFFIKDIDLIHLEPDAHWYFGVFLNKLLNRKSLKIAVTIHGVAPLIYPEIVPRSQFLRVKYFLKNILPYIDIIFTVSESEKSLIAEYLKVDKNKIFVTYNGNKYEDKEFLIRDYDFPHDKDYILHISNSPLSGRKRADLLLESFNEFAKFNKDIDLLLIGKGWNDTKIKQKVSKLNIENQIKLIGNVESSELPKYYKGAKLYLQTSLYESFCLPVVEAMTFGTPVLSTHAYAIPEIAKEGAVIVEDNPVKIAEKANEILSSKNYYNKISKKSKEIAELYTWDNTARKTLEVYNNILMRD